MSEKTKLPFAEDDFLEHVNGCGAKVKMKIVGIVKPTNALFVVVSGLSDVWMQLDMDKALRAVNRD